MAFERPLDTTNTVWADDPNHECDSECEWLHVPSNDPSWRNCIMVRVDHF